MFPENNAQEEGQDNASHQTRRTKSGGNPTHRTKSGGTTLGAELKLFFCPIDWSVCLLTLKHLVSLQARTRPSVQIEIDLHTTTDLGDKHESV